MRQAGIIDNAESFIEDFGAITLDESRAVLCIHILCYVLDGSISIRELRFWGKLVKRVDDLYQEDRTKMDGLSVAELRKWIVLRKPALRIAVSRVPTDVEGAGADWRNDHGSTEMEELRQLALQVPTPEHVARLDRLVPRVICQKFRANIPVTTGMLLACFDVDANQKFLAKAIQPDKLLWFMISEFAYNVMRGLTAQV